MRYCERKLTCGDCAHNWMGEECELDGHEIYDDSSACENFEPTEECINGDEPRGC